MNIECSDWIKLNFPGYCYFQELEKLKKENKELYEELMELRRQVRVRISHTTRSKTVNYFAACITPFNVICTTLRNDLHFEDMKVIVYLCRLTDGRIAIQELETFRLSFSNCAPSVS